MTSIRRHFDLNVPTGYVLFGIVNCFNVVSNSTAAAVFTYGNPKYLCSLWVRILIAITSYIIDPSYVGIILANRPPGDMTVILKIYFSNSPHSLTARVLTMKIRNCSQIRWTPKNLGNENGEVSFGSGNGLVPLGNKPLPGPMLTQICDPIWRH